LQERLERIGLDAVTLATLTINYRTPREVMAEAEPVIRSELSDANVPTSIRSNGIAVEHASVSELDSILVRWLAEHADGTACIIGERATSPSNTNTNTRVQVLSPELTKGLEFDLVVHTDPETFGTGIEGAVDRYVAMTRATQQLVRLTTP
jgi:DNA helicase IV